MGACQWFFLEDDWLANLHIKLGTSKIPFNQSSAGIPPENFCGFLQYFGSEK
jgi:hypothetical protein